MSKFSHRELRYAIEYLSSASGHRRDWVGDFEESFAKQMGCKYAIAVNSGTSGLHAALHAVGVGPGDEVIQPALTVVMDAYACFHLGARPVFADVDPNTWLVTADTLLPLITKKTKAIITVSWQGQPVDMNPIREVAAEHGIKVIDDSAQTLFGRYQDSISGTNADAGVFSFEDKKHMTSGSEGGMIATNDPDIAVRARKFAGIGYRHLTAERGRTSLAADVFQRPDYLRFDTIGYNYRMNKISAAIGLGQLESARSLVARRRAVARLFSEATSWFPHFVQQKVPEKCDHTYYTFPVMYTGETELGASWSDLYTEFKERGGDGFYGHVALPYMEPSLASHQTMFRVGANGRCPNAERVQPLVMQFKTNYRDLAEAEHQAHILRETLESIS